MGFALMAEFHSTTVKGSKGEYEKSWIRRRGEERGRRGEEMKDITIEIL